MIEEAIAGRTLLVTGTTGFLGKSVVEKLLRALPQVGRIHLAIRSSARRPASDRLEREVLASPAFRRLKKEMGEEAFRRLAAEKLSDIETRLSEMATVRDELRSTLKDWDSRLTKTVTGERAALLDALADSKTFTSRKSARLSEKWRQRKPEKDTKK